MTGKNHDRSSMFLSFPLIAVLGTYVPEHCVAIAVGYFAGFLYLSPDVDLPQSRPSKRWGIFRPIWIPYQKARKHRGRSHWPIIGSGERLLFAAVIPLTVWGLFNPAIALDFLRDDWRSLLALWAGVELACWWHLICDHVWPLKRF